MRQPHRYLKQVSWPLSVCQHVSALHEWSPVEMVLNTQCVLHYCWVALSIPLTTPHDSPTLCQRFPLPLTITRRSHLSHNQVTGVVAAHIKACDHTLGEALCCRLRGG